MSNKEQNDFADPFEGTAFGEGGSEKERGWLLKEADAARFRERLRSLGYFEVWATKEGIIVMPEEIDKNSDRLDALIDAKEKLRQIARENGGIPFECGP